MAEGTPGGGSGPVLFSGYVQIGVATKTMKEGLAAAKQNQSAFISEVNRTWLASQRIQVDARRAAVDQLIEQDERAERSLKRLPDGIRTAGTQAGSMMSALGAKGGRAFLEFSRGAEDFMVQLGPMGLAGALRGAGNNISQMFALISPMAGAFAGIGLAVGTALINPIMRLFEETERSTEAVNRLGDAMKYASEQAENIQRFGRLSVSIGNMVKPALGFEREGRAEEQHEIEREMRQRRGIDMRALEDEERRIKQGIKDARLFTGNKFVNPLTGQVGEELRDDLTEQEMESYKEAQKRLGEIAAERAKLNTELLMLDQALRDSKKREERESQQTGGMAGGLGMMGAMMAQMTGPLLQRQAAIKNFDEKLESMDPDTRVAQAKRIAQETEKMIEDLRKADVVDPVREQKLRDMAAARIEEMAKEPKEKRDKAEMTGIADLSKKIQLSLMPDRQTKAAEEAASELKEQSKTLKDIAKSVKVQQQQQKFVAVIAPGL